MFEDIDDAKDYYKTMKQLDKPLTNELKVLKHSLIMNQGYSFGQTNAIFDVNQEKERIESGYYLDINSMLGMLKQSYDVPVSDTNPFENQEHNTVLYLEYLKQQVTLENEKIRASTLVDIINENHFNNSLVNNDIWIPGASTPVANSSFSSSLTNDPVEIENIEDMLTEMSNEDISEIENILANSMTETPLKEKHNNTFLESLKCHEQLNEITVNKNVSDNKSFNYNTRNNNVGITEKFPNYHLLKNKINDCFEEKLINKKKIILKGITKDFLQELENNQIIKEEIFNFHLPKLESLHIGKTILMENQDDLATEDFDSEIIYEKALKENDHTIFNNEYLKHTTTLACFENKNIQELKDICENFIRKQIL